VEDFAMVVATAIEMVMVALAVILCVAALAAIWQGYRDDEDEP
jgi:hypothetical protein